ncbi:hypothetical protein PR202_ga16676 [Eleusine coracana subsp. coracana]|uniref:Uncharacterized protein n=1 Tax=Eleusine coracana subsp. coracana TaxID=191504 RepID=A0AAV5CNH0_ELECO|nr:hypothetical protein PR202_ga16676 [Eleusine coracana subsp. coracana]
MRGSRAHLLQRAAPRRLSEGGRRGSAQRFIDVVGIGSAAANSRWGLRESAEDARLVLLVNSEAPEVGHLLQATSSSELCSNGGGGAS